VKLKGNIETSFGAIGFLAYSGNGFHLHFPLPRFELVGEKFPEEINEKSKVLRNVNCKGRHLYGPHTVM
jgi:hypothetical protein